MVLGNGTVTAKYIQIGKSVFARFTIVFGTTTSVTGDIGLSLPVTAAAYGGVGTNQIGSANLFDMSAGRIYQATVNMSTTTKLLIRPQAADLTFLYAVLANATTPFTWAATDEIAFSVIYEAA